MSAIAGISNPLKIITFIELPNNREDNAREPREISNRPEIFRKFIRHFIARCFHTLNSGIYRGNLSDF